MILLTQNLLVSPMAGASDQKPLGIEATEVEDKERDYDADFLKRMLERIDYDAFVAAARAVCAPKQLRRTHDLPEAFPTAAKAAP